MNEEIQKLKEEFDQRIRDLEDKYNPEEEGPKEGDDYWVVSSYGEAKGYRWRYYPIDKHVLKNNAIFRTEEEAKFEAERLKVLRELERIGNPFDCTSDNWFICSGVKGYVYCNEDISSIFMYGNYYFRTEDEAEKAVEKIGEDRIKKYLFGVKGGDSEQ